MAEHDTLIRPDADAGIEPPNNDTPSDKDDGKDTIHDGFGNPEVDERLFPHLEEREECDDLGRDAHVRHTARIVHLDDGGDPDPPIRILFAKFIHMIGLGWHCGHIIRRADSYNF